MEALRTDIIQKVFGWGVELIPNTREVFELELAYLEYAALPNEKLLERAAYIKSIDGVQSKHYLFCSSISGAGMGRSASANCYFQEGRFSTGYATHGLFPYRGKFHPQLVKALLNIFNIQEGETILDPMAGSGTANIESAVMGINSIAIDISPFCQFMIKTKYDALTIDFDFFSHYEVNIKEFFVYFSEGDVFNKISGIGDLEKEKIYNLAFLAWLDALGYSKRVSRSNHETLFYKVFNRYIKTIKDVLNNPYFEQHKLGKLNILESNALKIDLPDESVDCVITSPPYSFAIDYAENDKEQLLFLGYDIEAIKENMIGLKGKTKEEKLNQYFKDTEKYCAEVQRVLKREKYFAVIIGSNTNQTGGVRLENIVIGFAKKYNMRLENGSSDFCVSTNIIYDKIYRINLLILCV
jgi:DNA modification methylase